MTDADALHAQIAQRLFGWTEVECHDGFLLWKSPEGTMHLVTPAYTTDPRATAEVWRWVEERDGPLCQLRFLYGDNLEIDCVVYHGGSEVVGWGDTWPEALCRAALALAAAVGEEAG